MLLLSYENIISECFLTVKNIQFYLFIFGVPGQQMTSKSIICG